MYVIYKKEIFMLALLVIFSYLMGSIPTGYIIVKKKFNKDIRKFG
ncbi:glycerol-3-phosphate acyltransferase, partial [uncultured Clostridium sp.]